MAAMGPIPGDPGGSGQDPNGPRAATGPNPGAHERARANPAALTVADTARLLTAAGGRPVIAEQIQADLDAGAPAGVGATINLVHYAAWLIREMARGSG